jgi:cytochrome c oxidase subunit 3
VTTVPWTYEERPDTRTTNVRLGIWLFLASEAMFFGSLFSGYVLLRTGAGSWPDAATTLDLRMALLNTALLFGASLLIIAPAKAGALTGGPRAHTKDGALHSTSEGPGFSARRFYFSAALSAMFLAVKLLDYRYKIAAGLHPSTNLLLACWFTLTAVHAIHVAAGTVWNLWMGLSARRMSAAQRNERLWATRLYWLFVDAVWLVILLAFYVW